MKYPMIVTLNSAKRGTMVWEYDDSKSVEKVIEALKVNVIDWTAISVTISNPEMEPKYDVWDVRPSESEPDYPNHPAFDVLLPNGEWFGVVAVDEEDAVAAAKKDWEGAQSRA